MSWFPYASKYSCATCQRVVLNIPVEITTTDCRRGVVRPTASEDDSLVALMIKNMAEIVDLLEYVRDTTDENTDKYTRACDMLKKLGVEK